MYKATEKNNLKMEFPCMPGDIIYRTYIPQSENDESYTESYLVDNIVIGQHPNDMDDIIFKYDAHDGIICTLDNLLNGSLYLDCYKIFLSPIEADDEMVKYSGGKLQKLCDKLRNNAAKKLDLNYTEITTIADLLEVRIAQKPEYGRDDQDYIYCPRCGGVLDETDAGTYFDKFPYCPYCGQSIDWK